MPSHRDTAPSPASAISTQIRSRLVSGKLPRHSAGEKLYAGYGENQVCECCGHLIRDTEVLFEIEFKLGAWSAQIIYMHRECFDAWVAECRRLFLEKELAT